MLSLLPSLLDLYPFAAFLLRVTAGYLFVIHGWNLYKELVGNMGVSMVRTQFHRIVSFVHIMVGLLFIAGIFVQGAAIVGALITFLGLEATLTQKSTTSEREVHLLLCVISLALLVLGAGPFAFDLPL